MLCDKKMIEGELDGLGRRKIDATSDEGQTLNIFLWQSTQEGEAFV
jgi:hypothetical protein